MNMQLNLDHAIEDAKDALADADDDYYTEIQIERLQNILKCLEDYKAKLSQP